MQAEKPLSPPYIRKGVSTATVMTDVILVLLPCIFMACLAFGTTPLIVVLVAVGSALLAEFLFNRLYFGDSKSLSDGSAIITGMLLAFTLAPFTPLYVVAFGGAMAVIFGKLLWGGLGRNCFNPALVGRECMTIFFPAAMASRSIWYNADAVNTRQLDWLGEGFLGQLVFKPAGAIGEYSIFFLVLGGLYLLYRRRISWHVPFALCTVFAIGVLIFPGQVSFSLGGVLLGAVYMATDMPTSSSTRWGKLYYGGMIAAAALACLFNEVRYEYLSYSILLLNGFVRPINWVFRPRVWGTSLNLPGRLLQGCGITLLIAAACAAVILLHHAQLMHFLVLAYIAFCIVFFSWKQRRAAQAA